MKKFFIYIIFPLFMTFEIDGMFRFWIDHQESIEQAKNLKVKAEKLVVNNPSNVPLQDYLKSLESIEIDEHNSHVIKSDLQTLLFIGNTYAWERLKCSSSVNLPDFSFRDPFERPRTRILNSGKEISAMISDTQNSFRSSDAIVAACSFVIADSLAQRSSNNLVLSFATLPLYVLVPLTALWLKKCSWDMNSILLKNSHRLHTDNNRLDTSNRQFQEENHRAVVAYEALKAVEKELQQENFLLEKKIKEEQALSVIKRTLLKHKLNKDKASALHHQQEAFHVVKKQLQEEKIELNQKEKKGKLLSEIKCRFQQKIFQENLRNHSSAINVLDEIDEIPYLSSSSNEDQLYAQNIIKSTEEAVRVDQKTKFNSDSIYYGKGNRFIFTTFGNHGKPNQGMVSINKGVKQASFSDEYSTPHQNLIESLPVSGKFLRSATHVLKKIP